MNLLGIDFGEKNIGLALARDEFISPLDNLKYQNKHVLEEMAIKKIAELVISEKIDKVIIGEINPKNQALAVNMREFVARLKTALIREQIGGKLSKKIKHVSIEFVSEENTSKDAVILQINSGISKKASRNSDHSFSAAEILKRYLERE